MVSRSLSDERLSIEQAHSLTSNLVMFQQVLAGKVLEKTNRDVPRGAPWDLLQNMDIWRWDGIYNIHISLSHISLVTVFSKWCALFSSLFNTGYQCLAHTVIVKTEWDNVCKRLSTEPSTPEAWEVILSLSLQVHCLLTAKPAQALGRALRPGNKL